MAADSASRRTSTVAPPAGNLNNNSANASNNNSIGTSTAGTTSIHHAHPAFSHYPSASGIASGPGSGAGSGAGFVPPAPPLPPSKRDPSAAAPAGSRSSTSYFSRFVTQPLSTAYGSRPPSSQTNRPNGARPNTLVPRLLGSTSGSSQDASHKTGIEITALDVNREGTHAILAGREILKTIRVVDAKCAEETNLRAAIINYAAHNASVSAARHREALEIHDVKWSHGQFSSLIATAATNGKVILYDLNRTGMELARLHEHHRQVHKLAFNPHQGYLLLSASQDATVRLWDLRDLRKEFMTCPSRDKFSGLSEGIRDVQWSPTDGFEFAFGTDNGVIQSWDYRNSKGPKLKLNAHEQKTCTSIDWHPDGKHLLSASVDKTVRVWDFSSDNRRQKPAHVIRTPYPVHRARWRPPYWAGEGSREQGTGSYQCTQLATSYDREHSPVHIWDFRRPHLPFREINKYGSAPNDVLWHSRDLLWTVGREGVFTQTDVHFSPKVVDRRNLQVFAISPGGEIAGFAQQRPPRRGAGRSGLEYDDTYMDEKQRSSPEKNSLRNSADDSVDESFLSSHFKRHHGRTASNRSARSFGSTPPPSDVAPKVMYLTDSLEMQGHSPRQNQIAIRGPLPGAPSVQMFTYLAQKYKAIALPDPPTLQAFEDLQHVFDQNAQYAQRAAFYRLAQTWRLVGSSLAVASKRRAELHRKRALQARPSLVSSNVKSLSSNDPPARDKEQAALHLNPARHATEDKLQPPHTTESTSNLSTPLARPFTTITAPGAAVPQLPNPDHEDELNLPPSLTAPQASGKAVVLPAATAAHRRPSFNGPHWYSSNDLDERRAMIGSWRAPPRPPLSLEPPAHGINIKIPRLDRHDSDESFTMFSASTDSQRNASMPSSLSSCKSHPHQQGMEPIPEKWSRSPAESSFGNSRHPAEILGKSVLVSPTTVPVDSRRAGPGGEQGTGRHGSGHPADTPGRDQAVKDIESLRRNNQLLRHDSSESEAFSRAELSISSADASVDMAASGTIVPEALDETRSPPAEQGAPSLVPAAESAPAAMRSDSEQRIQLADFQAMDVDGEQGLPFTLLEFLKGILAFHTGTLSDAQTASLLILLLGPLLPQTHPVFEHEGGMNKADVLANYGDVFAAIGFSPGQTETVLSTQLSQLLATGLNPYEAESILLAYHSQLHSLSLFNAAASLRRLAYPTFPAVYEQALKDTQLGLLCLSCKSPINNPKDKMRCETCRRAQAPCPICWGRYPAFEKPSTKKKKVRAREKVTGQRRNRPSLNLPSGLELNEERSQDLSPSVPEELSMPRPNLWTWCPLCGHGGHTDCLSTWFADALASDGACPTEGCLCDCVRGRRRDEKLKEVIGRKAEKESKKLVRGDHWKVSESKAVGTVRGALGEREGGGGTTTTHGGASAGGIVPLHGLPREGSSSGTGTGRRDGADNREGRRVRVVVPHDAGVI